jgi:DNA-binding transcriptional LysR family regulator
LRLSAPRAVVPLILEPVIASFCQAYPEIELESRKRGDGGCGSGGFDAGIRLGRLPDPSEICALEFKAEFLRFEIRSVSATIGIDRLIL